MANTTENTINMTTEYDNSDYFYSNPDLVDSFKIEKIESEEKDLILFQMHNSEIVMNALLHSNDRLANLNTLYVSGTIDSDTYYRIVSRITKEISYRQLSCLELTKELNRKN